MARMIGACNLARCPACRAASGPDCADAGRGKRAQKAYEERQWRREAEDEMDQEALDEMDRIAKEMAEDARTVVETEDEIVMGVDLGSEWQQRQSRVRALEAVSRICSGKGPYMENEIISMAQRFERYLRDGS
jgi:hypothetical protein